MDEEENIKKNLKYLGILAKEEKYVDVRVCPECKSAELKIFDIIGLYAPLSPVRALCKNCGWVGRTNLEMSNCRISEKDEEVLEDIISMFSEEQ